MISRSDKYIINDIVPKYVEVFIYDLDDNVFEINNDYYFGDQNINDAEQLIDIIIRIVDPISTMISSRIERAFLEFRIYSRNLDMKRLNLCTKCENSKRNGKWLMECDYSEKCGKFGKKLLVKLNNRDAEIKALIEDNYELKVTNLRLSNHPRNIPQSDIDNISQWDSSQFRKDE
jgi:hypothetical protein